MREGLRARAIGNVLPSVTWTSPEVQELFRAAAEARKQASSLAVVFAGLVTEESGGGRAERNGAQSSGPDPTAQSRNPAAHGRRD